MIKKADDSFTEDLVNCDGSGNTIFTDTTCSVPISTLRTAPFSLPWGSSIYVQVYSLNVVGTSLASSEGNGAVITTYPDAPINAVNDALVTDSSTIKFSWSEGSSNGGALINDYRVSYAVTGSDTFTELSSSVLTTDITTSQSAGTSYDFRVESRNSFGYSQTYLAITILQA
jgi:hypothetical protein